MAYSEPHPLLGLQLPELSVDRWVGEPRDPAALRGRIIVLDFWATWCMPCLGSIPKNNRIAADYGEMGVEFIGVCASTGGEELESVVRDRGIAYSCACDREKLTERALHVQYFPAYFLIGRDGLVREACLGPDQITDALDDLLVEDSAAQ